MSFSKIALTAALTFLSTGSDAFAPGSPLALRSRPDVRTASLGLCMSSSSPSPASKTAAVASGEVVGKAAPTSRRDFGKLIAGIVVAGWSVCNLRLHAHVHRVGAGHSREVAKEGEK